ncbi:hypothetical protein CIT37_41470 [Bradyrhizobium ottawaense]|uniref:hypothetical protein n=1 Tax=Bradyrhizobium ottawaense TaxID=931866 RepID=UPI00142E2B03|nr:hypothetical protein [Bradyrhizobium ottawaense]
MDGVAEARWDDCYLRKAVVPAIKESSGSMYRSAHCETLVMPTIGGDPTRIIPMIPASRTSGYEVGQYPRFALLEEISGHSSAFFKA